MAYLVWGIMSRQRIFRVTVNVDDMTAILSGLDGTEEKADWLDGYLVGVHGHEVRESWPKAKRSGFDFGAIHFAEAETFRAEQTVKSAAAVAAKAAKKSVAVPNGVPAGVPGDVPKPASQLATKPTNEKASQPGQACRILLNDWTPDSGHSGICAQRNLSMEMQLERFRSQHGATLDTPEGWSRRFYGWIAQGRPEPIFSPVAPMAPPTLQEWTDRAYEFARTHQPFKSEDPGYFWPGELARAKWSAHQATGWARIVDWKAQLEADCETWNGYERANRKRPAR